MSVDEIVALACLPLSPSDAVVTAINAEVVDEGRRLAGNGDGEQLNLKLLGGVAVAVACPEALTRAELRRIYKDLDFAAPRKRSKAISDFLVSEGYVADRPFNALHGATRLLFFDTTNGRQVDVFLDVFNMCHFLDLRERFATPWAYLAPSDLLLMKLQIVQLNEKDVVDAIALALQHECGTEDGAGTMSVRRIAQVCSGDWGWYTTIRDNVEVVRDHAVRVLGQGADAELVAARLGQVISAIDDAPKSVKWKLRARVGRRVKWYELPDEVG